MSFGRFAPLATILCTSAHSTPQQWLVSPTLSGNDCISLHTTSAESRPQSNTFVKSIHICLMFRSRTTASTISCEIPIAIIIMSPSPSLRTSSPHSFSTNAASLTWRFIMHARSASVQCTTVCTAVLPSCTGMVSYILSSGTCTVGPDELKAN